MYATRGERGFAGIGETADNYGVFQPLWPSNSARNDQATYCSAFGVSDHDTGATTY